MTDEELQRLKALCAAATGGEWEWERRGWPGNEGWTLFAYVHEGIDPITGIPSKYLFHPYNLLTVKDGHDGFDWNGEANRAFIAAACTWLPRLLAEREELLARCGESE